MRKLLPVLVFGLMASQQVLAQASNFHCTNAAAEQVMLGNYNPATYTASTVLNHPDTLAAGILARVNADSLKAYIIHLAGFRNRNSGADTLSTTHGYGASRRWVHQKFQQFSAVNENRLLPAFLKFDQNICSIGQHSDVIAVLPGMDTTDKRVVLIEGHMDSRCEGLCDTACSAQGVEDNASGTALVMELARIMSRYSYNHTIVFMVTTAEEQGLYGAEAFADYAQLNNLGILCVQNNDVIGGIICGTTSSAPSCPGLGNIDSTHVRLFSAGTFNSPHKQYARFIKLEYAEEIKALALVKTNIMIMTPEDRTGRGGDHIPFRQHGYTAMRFTSANEAGDANVTSPGYADRQHTTRDTLGVDTDGDMVIDSFFVDFNYLARNTVINGNAAAMAAIGPKTPDFTAIAAGVDSVKIDITTQTGYDVYRVAVRTNTNDWDTVFYMTDTTGIFHLAPAFTHYISVASVDDNGVESLFSGEKLVHVSIGIPEYSPEKDFALLSNKPNPFDESTTISVMVNKEKKYKTAYILVTDLGGKEVQRLPITLQKGMNEVMYTHGYHATGTFLYSLVVDGVKLQTGKMVFAN